MTRARAHVRDTLQYYCMLACVCVLGDDIDWQMLPCALASCLVLSDLHLNVTPGERDPPLPPTSAGYRS